MIGEFGMVVGRRVVLGTGLSLLRGIPPASAAADAPAVRVENAWSRPTAAGADTAVVYMTLTAGIDDALTAISTPAARQAELHLSTETGGIMRMRPVSGGLVLRAGKPVSIAPGGYHVMLTGLAARLRAGDRIALHLTFARSRPVDVTATVRAFGVAPAMPGMDMR